MKDPTTLRSDVSKVTLDGIVQLIRGLYTFTTGNEYITLGTALQITTDPAGTPIASALYATGIPKAWIRFNMATDAIADSFNVSSITDGAAGQDTIVFDRDFSSASFAAVGSANYVGLDRAVWALTSFAAGSVLAVANRYASGAAEDATEFNAAFFGDQ